jgi:hypothetical protein
VTAFKVGDRVTPAHAPGVPPDCLFRTFIVRKVNPKNLKCDAEDGGRGISFPACLLLPATDDNLKRTGVPYKPRELFCMGEVVTLTKAWKTWTTETPLVVLADSGDKSVKVALLGGEGDRYACITPSGLVKRDLAWLTESLVEAI